LQHPLSAIAARRNIDEQRALNFHMRRAEASQ
jgi:hypothetical protein